jgi:hypothetical protein
MANLRWNEQAGRFTDSAGRFVSESRVRAVVDAIADQASARMAAASERMLAGDLSLASWQAEGQAVIKTSMLAAGVIGNGGAAQMSFSEYGYLGQQIRQQYEYMAAFAADIASGRQPSHGGLVARARMYGQQSRVIFEKVRQRDAAGRALQSCRNIVHAQESCSQCRSLAASGWMAIAEMPPVGSRICLGNCRCTIEYRSQISEAAA